jgi:hypothetical protein
MKAVFGYLEPSNTTVRTSPALRFSLSITSTGVPELLKISSFTYESVFILSSKLVVVAKGFGYTFNWYTSELKVETGSKPMAA